MFLFYYSTASAFADYLTDRGYWTDVKNAERNFGWNQYSDNKNFAYGQFSDDRSYNYQLERDKIADEQWQKSFDEGVRQYKESLALSKKKIIDDSGDDGVFDYKVDPIKVGGIENTLNQIIKGGASESEIAFAIGEQYRMGNITKGEYDNLMETYVRPKGSSGGRYAY